MGILEYAKLRNSQISCLFSDAKVFVVAFATTLSRPGPTAKDGIDCPQSKQLVRTNWARAQPGQAAGPFVTPVDGGRGGGGLAAWRVAGQWWFDAGYPH